MTHDRLHFDFSTQATVIGYHPFIRFSPLEYLTITEIYGPWAFQEILPRLPEPEKVHRIWAVRFLGAAARLPRDEINSASNLFEFVTDSIEFKGGHDYQGQYWTVFFRVYKKLKAAHKQMPEGLRTIYKDDITHWRRWLMSREHKPKRKSEKKNIIEPRSGTSLSSRSTPIIVYKKSTAQPTPQLISDFFSREKWVL